MYAAPKHHDVKIHNSAIFVSVLMSCEAIVDVRRGRLGSAAAIDLTPRDWFGSRLCRTFAMVEKRVPSTRSCAIQTLVLRVFVLVSCYAVAHVC